MPDITMCVGLDCPIKHTCYRYTATYTATPHNARQSIADFRGRTFVTNEKTGSVACDEFIPARRITDETT